MKKPSVILLLGMPGTGKGTQGALLAKYLKCQYLIAGDYIREAYREGRIDEWHRDLIERYDKGLLQTDATINKIFDLAVKKSAKNHFKNGVILDAYPMSVPQAKNVDKFVKDYNLADAKALFIEVTEEEILKRLSKGRLVCVGCKKKYGAPDETDIVTYCQKCAGVLERRSDDKPDVILNRFREYAKRLRPVLEYYEKREDVIRVNGEQSVEAVFAEIVHDLKKLKIA